MYLYLYIYYKFNILAKVLKVILDQVQPDETLKMLFFIIIPLHLVSNWSQTWIWRKRFKKCKYYVITPQALERIHNRIRAFFPPRTGGVFDLLLGYMVYWSRSSLTSPLRVVNFLFPFFPLDVSRSNLLSSFFSFPLIFSHFIIFIFQFSSKVDSTCIRSLRCW